MAGSLVTGRRWRAFSTLLRWPVLQASSGGILATKSERKMLASTCLYLLYAWLLLLIKLTASIAYSCTNMLLSQRRCCVWLMLLRYSCCLLLLQLSVCGVCTCVAHMLSQHGTAPPGVKVHSCPLCDYKCIDKNRFEEHEAMHTGLPRSTPCNC